MPTPDLTFTPPSDAELAAAVRGQSLSDPRTVDRLLALWATYALLKNLPSYEYDRERAAFIHPNGRALRDNVVRGNLQRVANGIGRERMGALTRALQRGDLSLASWHRQMSDAGNDAYLLAALIALGGLTMVSSTPFVFWPPAYAQMDFQQDKLRGFAIELQADWEKTRVDAYGRGIMYGAAMYGIFVNSGTTIYELLGYDQERRVLGAAEHCADCVGYASVGWRPIGSTPAIGDSRCMSHCHCYKVYRKKPSRGG